MSPATLSGGSAGRLPPAPSIFLRKATKSAACPKLVQDWGKAVAAKVAEWLDLGGGGPELPAPQRAAPPRFSDEALALAFAERHADALRYVAQWSEWRAWTGTHWRSDSTLRAFDLSRQIVREFATTCAKKGAATQLASAKTVAAVERLAKADRRLAAADDQWDGWPAVLNTPKPGK
jgi:hypothetical protein